jgi:two-component sensor histidine kinase
MAVRRPFSWFRLDTATIALSLLLLIAAVAVQIVSDHRSAMDRAVATAETDARLIAEHANVVFRTADRTIQATIDYIGDRPLDEIESSPEFPKILRLLASDLISGGSISVFDREGRLLQTTSPSTKPGDSFGDREYFQALASGAPFYIGRVAAGRMTGSPVVILGRPIGTGAAFRGAVIVGMRASYFSDFYASVQLGPNSSVTLMRNDGVLLVRNPPAPIESRALIAPTIPADADQMINIGPSSIDRTERIAAMRRVPGQPLIINTAGAIEDFLAGWRRRSIAFGGFALLAIGLLSGMGFAALRATDHERAALQETRKLSGELGIALERERMMRRELLHRTKNNLAMMMAMLKAEGRHPNADRDSFVATANRISALAFAQEFLDHTTGGGDIDCAVYLGKIAHALGNAEVHRKVKLNLALESITLPAERAQALGLIVNELMTNSIKYAFVGRTSGTITLKLRTAGDEVLFDYEDDGPGFRGKARADSQGLRLISALCGTLQAQYAMSGVGGMHFTLSFPRSGEPLVGGPESASRAAAGA